MRLGPAGGDGLEIDGAGGAHQDTGAAGLALVGALFERGGHHAGGAATEEADGAAAHEVTARSHAQAAEDALVLRLGLEGGLRGAGLFRICRPVSQKYEDSFPILPLELKAGSAVRQIK